MPNDWRQDPRVKSMHPEKIEFLCQLTDQIQRTPKNQLMNRFLSLTLEANQKGISFSDRETDLLAGILINYMDPADRGKLELFRMMSKKLASGHG